MDLYAGKEGRVGYYRMDFNFRGLEGLNSGGCVVGVAVMFGILLKR